MTDARCTAQSQRTGTRCVRKVAIGDRCWGHGANVPGPCALTLDGGKPVIWFCDERGGFRRNPRLATKWAAVQLVLRGVIQHGWFLGHKPQRFLRRLERAGVTVVPAGVGFGRVFRYRFEAAKSQAA